MLQRMLNTMIETKHIIAELSVQEKICLYNALYEDLASKGIDGDTELAHVNKAEMEALRAMGGSGTINPNTNLIQFGGGSPPPPPPTSQTVSQTSEFPEELKPYITDVLGKAQAIQEKREQEGYRPYEGPQIAEFTPEQQQSFTGISGLVGEGGKYFDPATRLAASSAIAPRAGEVQQYMSPYMQNVVDIQQREAQRQADVAAQQLGAQAVSAGGFGGSRQAILEAEQQRNLQTQLGDIQARGLAAAYEDAQARIAAQRQRELAASGQFAQLGQIAPQQALKELTALEAVGAQQQALSQRGLDIAKSQFEAEQTFPESTLQQYQSVIRGFPLDPSFTRTSQTTTPAPSYLQQAAGLGATAVGLAGAFGGFSGRRAKGGLVSRMRGGQVDQNSGLGSIVVKRQAGSQIGGAQFGGMQFGGRRYGDYDPTLKDYPYSPENVEQYKKNLRERIAEREAALEASAFKQRQQMRLDEERREAISKLQQNRPGVLSEVFTEIEDRPALYEQRKDIDAQLRMLRNSNLGGGSPENVSPQAVSTPSSTSDDPLLEMSVEQEQPERGDTYIPSDEVDTVGFDPNIGQRTDSNNEGDGLKQTYNALNKLPGSEIRDKISKELETRATSRKARLDARKKGLDSDRWLSLANFGIGILQQPGGETFLRTIAKGAKESGIIASLSKLNREEADIADKLDTIDLDTLMKKYQLSKDEAAEFVRERDYGFKVKQAQDNLTLAKEKLAVSRSAAERKLAQAQANAARDQLKMLQTARKPLGKDAQEEWTKQFRGITKADNLRTILPEEMVERFDDLDLKDKDNLKEALRIKIAEIRTLYPSLSETQLLRQAFPIVYGPFLSKKKKT